MKTKNNFNGKKILVVNVNWIGDVLFSTPALKSIKNSYPSSYLACVVTPRCREVLENNPYVNELIFFDERETNRSFLSKLKFILLLKREKFDIVFIFHRSFTRALICWLAGIPERIGYYRKKTAFLLTKTPEPEIDIHRVDYFLNLLKTQGLKIDERNYQFFTKTEDRDFILKFLKNSGVEKGDCLVILNPGGNWDLKRWPPGNFSLLGDLIAERYKSKILITGAQKDKQLCFNIAEAMKHKPIVAAGQTTLTQLAALFQESQLVVSADSGPMHIAVSMEVPTIALFGPTLPGITGPIGRGKFKGNQDDVDCCLPCYKLDCPSNKCMQAITPGKVIEVIDEEKFL